MEGEQGERDGALDDYWDRDVPWGLGGSWLVAGVGCRRRVWGIGGDAIRLENDGRGGGGWYCTEVEIER